MGCGASKTTALENGNASMPFGTRERKPPVAFEVPADSEEIQANSIIKNHPPKRFRRLEDQQVQLTVEQIAERQAEAEKRRLEILQQRVQSARIRTERSAGHVRAKPIEEGDETM